MALNRFRSVLPKQPDRPANLAEPDQATRPQRPVGNTPPVQETRPQRPTDLAQPTQAPAPTGVPGYARVADIIRQQRPEAPSVGNLPNVQKQVGAPAYNPIPTGGQQPLPGYATPNQQGTFAPPAYDALTYDTARQQASEQLNPLYEQALASLARQQFEGEQRTGQIASSRGLAQSGLAADALNKLALGVQQASGDLEGQRASQTASMAQMLMQSDRDRSDRMRQFALQEYLARQGIGMQQQAFDYGKTRDTIGDQFRISDMYQQLIPQLMQQYNIVPNTQERSTLPSWMSERLARSRRQGGGL